MAKTSSAKKPSRRDKALEALGIPSRAHGGSVTVNGLDVELEEETPIQPTNGLTVNPDTGSVHIEHEDGSITIDPHGDSLRQSGEDISSKEHYANLADLIDYSERSRIVEECLTAIEAYKRSRSQWEQARAKSVELLGMKLEDPKANVSTSALGMSTSVVRDPVLLEAVENFCATSFAELCPAAGPVKCQNNDKQTAGTNDLAQALEDDMNYYLTPGGVAKEYYPDTRHMLWWTGLASGTFKKVYKCPRRNRPVSEYVDGTKLIVPPNATDLHNAGFLAHESTMRQAIMSLMQHKKVYRKVALSEPMQAKPNVVEQKVANVEGITVQSERIEDQEYTIYECYVELNIRGLEHKDENGETGLMLPYRLTIEENSREMLQLSRNWEEDDVNHNAQIPFVLFPFSTGMSRIYGSGLGQMGGNLAAALTALMRITIDSGMMNVYPGLLKAKGAGRQLVNELMVPPGGCAEIDTGGLPIQQTVMSMPFAPPSPVMIEFSKQMRELAQRVLGSANIPVGEGTADVPVGTMLAQVEQATKVIGAVHKALHCAQDEELQLLRKLLREDPAALWRGDKRNRVWALGINEEERKQKFIEALDNCLIRPRSDPNIPSNLHRLLIATWLLQVSAAPQVPGTLLNQQETLKRAAQMMGVGDFDALLNPPAPPQQGPDPKTIAALITAQARMLDSQTKQQALQVTDKNKTKELALKGETEAMKLAHSASAPTGKPDDPNQKALLYLKDKQLKQKDREIASKDYNAHQDREAKLSVEAMKIANTVGVHPESDGVVDEQLSQMSSLIKPAGPGMGSGGAVEGDEGDEGAADPQTVALYQRALEDIARALVEQNEELAQLMAEREAQSAEQEPVEEGQKMKPSREPLPFSYFEAPERMQ
jgi:hypothetical protein